MIRCCKILRKRRVFSQPVFTVREQVKKPVTKRWRSGAFGMKPALENRTKLQYLNEVAARGTCTWIWNITAYYYYAILLKTEVHT